jgi:putative restriction endonuclease
MKGTVAITDHGWYRFLLSQDDLDEVNFWTPSAHWGFRGEVGAPFFFKLKARYDHAICGFAHFARYSRLPDWLAWETFGAKNGCPTLESMRERIGGIRARIDYRAQSPSNEIGCTCSRNQHSFNLTSGSPVHAIGHPRTCDTSDMTCPPAKA